MNDTLYIDDLDGAVTLFKSTEEGTETIAVFDEEHREVIQDLLTEVQRTREITEYVKSTIDFHYQSIDNDTGGFVDWMEFARELYLMFYGGEEE